MQNAPESTERHRDVESEAPTRDGLLIQLLLIQQKHAFDVAPGRVGLLYEDTGPPHDPFAAVALPDDTAEVDERPVGGLGLVLIAALASEVHYRREDGKNLISLAITGSATGSG